jgi:hypothetical protein
MIPSPVCKERAWTNKGSVRSLISLKFHRPKGGDQTGDGMRCGDLFFHQAAAERTPFFAAHVPNEYAEERGENDRQKHQLETDLSHLGFLKRSLFMVPLRKLVVGEETRGTDQSDYRAAHRQPTVGAHFHELILLNDTNYNAEQKKRQCPRESPNKIQWNDRLPGQNGQNQPRETQFAAIRAERGHQIESARFHNGRSLSERLGAVKMNLNTNYAERSYAGVGRAKTLAVLVILIAGTMFLGLNSAGAAETASAALQPVKAAVKVAPKLEASALEPAKPVIVKTMASKSGTVTGISASSISVLYEQAGDSEFEIQLPLDRKVQLDHYKSKSDIQMGDLVELQYEKVVENPKKPNEKISMTVKKIRFVKRPSDAKGLVSEVKE